MPLFIPGPVGDLEAAVREPEASPHGWMTICHPHPQYGGSMHNNVVEALLRAGIQAGYGVVTFHFRGVGDSAGSFDNGDGETEDLVAVTEWLASEKGCVVGDQVVAGYSFGAAVAGRALGVRLNPRAAIFTAFPLTMLPMTPAARSWSGPKYLLASSDDPYCPAGEALAFAHVDEAPFTVDILEGGGHFLGGHEEELARLAATFLSGLGA